MADDPTVAKASLAAERRATPYDEENRRRYGVGGGGFDLTNIDETSNEEIEGSLYLYLQHVRDRGQFYGLNALTFFTDSRPDISKLASMAGGGIPEGLIGHPARPVLQNIRVLCEYIRLGWESGIYNEFRELQMRGMTKAQIMEVVMYAQATGGGIRSMGHVHNAVGKSLLDWRDGAGLSMPEGWAPDPAAFSSGLDLSTGQVTDQDRRNLEAWYGSTIGWVPKSVRFGLEHNPRFVKMQRAKWEAIFRDLPKQIAPFLMLAQHTLTGFREGLREGASLAKAWGFTHDWVMEPICGMAYYFKGLEALEAPYDAIKDILDDWDR
jgi:hypothetical protein